MNQQTPRTFSTSTAERRARRNQRRLVRLAAAVSAACGLGFVAPHESSAATALFDFTNGLDWGFTGDQFNYYGANENISLWTFSGTAWQVDGVNAASRSLTAPVLTLGGGPVTVSFTHARTFETYNDGGILESSVNAGDFAQVLNFTSNGYDDFVNSEFNPLAGRPAFYGDNSSTPIGPLTSVADLGPATAGDTLQLRFNAGWDDSILRTAPNWSISSLVVTGVQALPAAYWTGTISSTWYGNNWASDQAGTPTPILPSAETDVIFSADTVAALSQSTTLDADFEIHSLTINDAAAVTIGGANTLTISGTSGTTGITVNSTAGLFTIDANLTLAGASNTITVNNGAGAVINGAISGTIGLVKAGTGTLTLTSTGNNYTGSTVVAEGLLQIEVADNVLPTATDLIMGTANSATTGGFDLSGHNQTVNSISLNTGNTGGIGNYVTSIASPATLTVSSITTDSVYGGTLTGDLALTKLGDGTTLTLTALNDYTGNTTIDGGNFIVTGAITNTDQLYVGYSNSNVSMTISNGGTVTDVSGTVGVSATATNNLATVTGVGSTWTSTGDLNVGFDGSDNILSIEKGGQVFANFTKVGGGLDAAGNEIDIDGAGSKLTNTNDLIVGYDGSENAVLLTNGGQATNKNAFIGLNIDASDNFVGVSDAGSLWTNTGTLYIGDAGSGNTLSIENGGKVTVDGVNQDAVIGFTSDAWQNLLQVSGAGSQFSNSSTLYIGDSGSNNELDVWDGGLVTSKNVRLGFNSGSDGNTANVDGVGSIWNISGTLRVGSAGDSNELEISNGGIVNVSGNTFVGYGVVADPTSGNNNLILVDGAGSALNAHALTIGRAGQNNAVILTDGGHLSATSITIAELSGSSGLLYIGLGGAPGTVDVPTITGGAGDALVIFAHDATGYVFAPQLTGNIGILSYGPGETILAHANTMAGDPNFDISGIGYSAIFGGTLRTQNDLALGTSALEIDGGILAVTGSLTLQGLKWSGGNVQLAPVAGDIVHVTTALTHDPVATGGQFLLDTAGIAQTTYTLMTFFSTDFNLGDFSALAVNPDVTLQYQFILNPASDVQITILGAQATGPILQNSAPVGIPTFADFTVNGPVTTGAPNESNTIQTLTFLPGGSLLIHQNLDVTQGPVVLVDGSSITLDGSLTASELNILNGGFLNGNGSINGNLINSGLVSPGHSPGQIRVTGNYTQTPSGVLRIEIAGRNLAQHDLLSVGGTAQLGGTLQLVSLGNFRLKRGDDITFLTAGAGVSGEFATLATEFPSDTIIEPKIVYRSNSVAVEAGQGSFGKFAEARNLTPNQISVARGLDKVVFRNRLPKLVDYLDARKLEKLPGDFDKIAPEELTSIFTIGTSLATVQSGNIQRRTDDLRSGASGFNAAGLALNGAGPSYSGGFGLGTGVAGPTGQDYKDSPPVAEWKPEPKWGAFLSGTGEWVSVGDTDNARGYDLTSGGFTLGLDYKVTPNLAIGLAAGYTGTSADLTDRGRVYVNGGKLGLYATYFQTKGIAPAPTMSKDSSKDSSKEAPAPGTMVAQGLYADLAVFGGYNSYDTRRSGLQGETRGDTDGGELNVLFGTGYDFKKGGLTFGPTATFNYTYLGTSDFTEHGSLAPLDIHGGKGESLRTAFGFKASYDWKVGSVLIRPEIRAAWQHEFGDAAYDLSSNFANGGSSSFLVDGPQLGRDSVLIGAGFAIQFSERCSTYFYYDGELGRKNYQSSSVTGGFRVAF